VRVSSWPLWTVCVMSSAAGCGGVDYRPVDLQLDIVGSLPEATETLHLCVADVGELSAGAGNGRVVFAGLPADKPATITVDFLDEAGTIIGGAGPAVFEATTTWMEQPQDQRASGCTAQGSAVPEEAAGWVLGVRFTEEPW